MHSALLTKNAMQTLNYLVEITHSWKYTILKFFYMHGNQQILLFCICIANILSKYYLKWLLRNEVRRGFIKCIALSSLFHELVRELVKIPCWRPKPSNLRHNHYHHYWGYYDHRRNGPGIDFFVGMLCYILSCWQMHS